MKIRKSEQIRGRQRRVWKAAAVFGAAVLLAWCNPMVSLAEATGTVLPNSVNIRKQPDQESDVIGSSTVGKEISIRGKVDVSGITWYQVYVDANTMGYVRADMIEKKGDGDIPTVTVAAESQPARRRKAAIQTVRNRRRKAVQAAVRRWRRRSPWIASMPAPRCRQRCVPTRPLPIIRWTP